MAAAALALVALSLRGHGSSSGDAPPEDPSHPTTDAKSGQQLRDTAGRERQRHLGEVAEKIEAATIDNPDLFSVGIDLDTASVVVWQKGIESEATAELRTELERIASPTPVEFRDSPLSRGEARQIQESVVSHYSQLKREGVTIALVGVIVAGGPLTVRYASTGAHPDLDMFDRLGISSRWPEDARVEGVVRFEEGDVAPF